MSRLIDADVFRKRIDRYPPEIRDIVKKELRHTPTIEQERKQRTGKWIKAKGSWYTPGGDPVWECSECGKGCHVYGVEHGTYGADIADGQWVACPNCGSKMTEDNQ